jgi:hypothetical protein
MHVYTVGPAARACQGPDDGGSKHETTWRNIPEDSHLHTHFHENMIFYFLYFSEI